MVTLPLQDTLKVALSCLNPFKLLPCQKTQGGRCYLLYVHNLQFKHLTSQL